MKKFLVLVFIMQISLIFATEAISGKYGWRMLEIPSGAVIPALGNTGSLISTDAFGFITNPTATIYQRKRAISFSHNTWIFDTKMDNISFVNNQGFYAYGFSVRAMDYGKIEARNEAGDYIGDFHPLEINIITNFSYRLLPHHLVGLNLTGLYSKIFNASSLGISTDFAYTYITPYQGLTVSAVIKNIGRTEAMVDERIKLPFSQSLSLMKDFELYGLNLQNEVKFINHADDNIKLNLGTNAVIYDIFNLRMGYKINYDSETYSLGFGLRYNNFLVDYGFIPFRNKIDDSHVVSLSILF